MATKKKKQYNALLTDKARQLEEKKERVRAAERGDIAPVRKSTTTSKDIAPVRTVVSDDIAPIARKWLQKGALSDGVSAKNIAKTILGTGSDLNVDIKAGVLGIGEKAVDAAATGIGALGGVFGNEQFKEKTKQFVAKDLYDEHKIAKMITGDPFSMLSGLMGVDEEKASILGQKSDDLAYSGGQLIGTVGLQAAGVPWFVTTGVTSFGGETEAAFREGANYKEAALRGGIAAGADVLTEKLTGGIKFGGKTLDDVMLRPLTNKISNKLARNLVNVGVDATGEGFEEVVASFANNLGSKLYKEENLQELLFSEEAVDEYIESFVGGAVLGGGAGGSRAISSIRSGRDYKTGLTDNEQKVLNAEVKSRIDAEEADGKKLSAKRKAAIEEEARRDLERGFVSIDTIESTLGGETYNTYQSMKDVEDGKLESLNASKAALEKQLKQLEQSANTVGNNRQYDAVKQQLEKAEAGIKKIQTRQQLSQEVNDLTAKDTYLRESYNEKTRRGQTYTADLSKYKSAKQQAIIQKAMDADILNNTNRTHEFVDMISKIAADKGVSFDFTNNQKLKESGFAIAGKSINGYVKDGTVTLNINAAKSMNTIVGHEITHVLEGTELYTEMAAAVKEYATTKGEYDSKLQEIQGLYKDIADANIENEVTADLVGEYLFTDEAFVRNLSSKNRNLFQKIYDEIKYLVKAATAGSKEARQLEKVKRTFDKAFKETTKKQTGTKLSLMQFEDGKRFVEVDQEQDLFKGRARKEFPTIAKEIINKKFNGQVVGHDHKMFVNGKGRDEYIHPSKHIKEDYVYDAKMRAAGELDNLLDAGIKLPNEPDGRDGHVHEGTSEWEYYKTIFKVGENYFEGVVNIQLIEKGKLFKDVTKIKDVTEDIMNSYGKNPKFQFLRTSSKDIISDSQENTTNFSLSGENSIAPIAGKWNVRGEDLALESNSIAPEPTVNSNTTGDIAPVRADLERPEAEKVTTSNVEFTDAAVEHVFKGLRDILPFAVRGQIGRTKQIIMDYAMSPESNGPEYDRPTKLYQTLLDEFSDNVIRRRVGEFDDVKSAIRSYTFKVSDNIKSDITDWEDYRKSISRRIKMRDDGLPVDVIYQGLVEDYPAYFPADITHPSDQLQHIAALARESSYMNEHVHVDSQDIRNAVRHIIEQTDIQKTRLVDVARRARQNRTALHAELMDNMIQEFASHGMDFDEVLKKAKDKSTFSSVDNTPQRFIEKTLGYKAGQVLNNITMEQVALNETEGIKWLNSFTNKKNGFLAQMVKKYGIKPGSPESAAAQMYGEGFYVNDKKEYIKYGEAELKKDFPDEKVRDNIRRLANDPAIRKVYDDTLQSINDSRVRNAYPEIPRRSNYFLHFRAMDDTFSRLGLPFNPNDIRAKDLPTDLNGVTADLKPGQPYFASAMQRKGHQTTYDLLGGLERYLNSAKNQIYHIDDIQKLRALRNYIATMYGQAHGLDGLSEMTDAEADERIRDVQGAHLSVFSRFLNEEANVLAGKTSMIDRSIEGVFGRRAISILDKINNQVASNMIGFNLSSSLTNLVSVVQGFSKASKVDAVKAFAQTAAEVVNRSHGRSDGFAEANPLIIRRIGAEQYTKTPYQRIKDSGFVLMGMIDRVSTEFIVRSKYNELTRKGMDSDQAHIEASKWAARILGDRSYGQQPLIFNSKTLGLFTRFQLEVRNQLDSMFYDTYQEAKLSTEFIEDEMRRNAATAAKVTWTVAQLSVLSWLFGEGFEKVAGYNPTLDIIGTILTACGFDDDEESEDTVKDNLNQAFLELLDMLPYTSTLTGGRIPITSALPVEELITGKDEYGGEKPRWETALEALPYYVAPTGVNQAKKTLGGLFMYNDDLPIHGSYTQNALIDKMKGEDPGKLRFSVEDTPQARAQAAVFGQWAYSNARQYFDEERLPLTEKKTQELADLDLPMAEYWKIQDGMKGLSKNAEKLDYINSLDLPISKKNILANNVVDREEPVDMAAYGEIASEVETPEEANETYTWMNEHPERYQVSRAVSDDLTEYMQIADALYNIKADKDSNGKSIRGTRKTKVYDYINELDISYEAKCILIKSEYPSEDAYNMDIINYLNDRDDITYTQMKTILEELDFTVDEKGNISW